MWLACMIMYLITVHAHKHSPLVPCACADGSGCRGHTPPTKYAMATFSLCFNVITGLLTGMTKNQTLPLASLQALWLAPAPAQQASFSKRAALSCRSFDQQNASLAVAMARGIKATLLCAHGPTVLTNPEPCSADFLSTRAARS